MSDTQHDPPVNEPGTTPLQEKLKRAAQDWLAKTATNLGLVTVLALGSLLTLSVQSQCTPDSLTMGGVSVGPMEEIVVTAQADTKVRPPKYLPY